MRLSFPRLRIHGAHFGLPSKMVGSRPMYLRNDSAGKEPGFCSEIPPAFSSLEEARNSMDFHWNTCIHFLNDFDDAQGQAGALEAMQMRMAAHGQKFSIVVKNWSVAFQAFLQKKSKFLDQQGLRAARSLELSHHFFAISLEIGGSVGVRAMEMAWDKFTARFKHIVHLASWIVNSSMDEHIGEKHGPGFCLDTNIVAPLYAVAHRCRDPIIRRKAVSILYAAPRQEGVWDSILTAHVAEKVISIEESGLGPVICAEDIPYSSRINGVQVKFDLYGRLGAVNYSRMENDHEPARHTVMEIISW